MSCEWEKEKPIIRCDRCQMSHEETSMYDSSKVHLTYKDLCVLCISSIEEIELVVDEDSGFAKIMEKKEIERLRAEF